MSIQCVFLMWLKDFHFHSASYIKHKNRLLKISPITSVFFCFFYWSHYRSKFFTNLKNDFCTKQETLKHFCPGEGVLSLNKTSNYRSNNKRFHWNHSLSHQQGNAGQLFSLEDEMIDCWHSGKTRKAKSFMWLFILAKMKKAQAAPQ